MAEYRNLIEIGVGGTLYSTEEKFSRKDMLYLA